MESQISIAKISHFTTNTAPFYINRFLQTLAGLFLSNSAAGDIDCNFDSLISPPAHQIHPARLRHEIISEEKAARLR